MTIAAREQTALGRRSSYLKHLPSVYSESDFMGRFLMIFEDILDPLQQVVAGLSHYFDPSTTPEELLPWLASWVNQSLDESWPIESRRELVRSALELYEWRGTRRGMKAYIRVYTGVEPEITEDFGGIALDGTSRLGRNTVLGGGRRHTFTVTLELDEPESVDLEKLKAIIESEKPAHAAYTLRVLGKGAGDAGKRRTRRQQQRKK